MSFAAGGAVIDSKLLLAASQRKVSSKGSVSPPILLQKFQDSLDYSIAHGRRPYLYELGFVREFKTTMAPVTAPKPREGSQHLQAIGPQSSPLENGLAVHSKTQSALRKADGCDPLRRPQLPERVELEELRAPRILN